MNPETTDKLNHLLEYLADSIQKGGDFVSSQAPLVAREIIVWCTVTSSIELLLLLLFTAGLIYGVRRIYKAIDDLEVRVVVPTLLLIIGGLILTAAGSAIIPSFIKCLTAPRLVVLDYLRGL